MYILVRPQFPRKVNFNVSLYSLYGQTEAVNNFISCPEVCHLIFRGYMQVLQMEMSTNHLSLSNSTNMAAMLNMLLLPTTNENAFTQYSSRTVTTLLKTELGH